MAGRPARRSYHREMRSAMDTRAEEAAESPAVEAAEQASGGENAEAATVAGPRAVGPALEAIAHNGTGGDGKPGAKGGQTSGHPQNRVLAVRKSSKSKFIKGAIRRPGALTAAVGGKPSQNMGKVSQLAASGSPLQKKEAGFYLHVLSKV